MSILAYTQKPKTDFSRIPTPSGDRYQIGAKLSIDPVTGEKIAEPGEKIDLDAYIQASAKSTDIVSIIERLKHGDESVINVNPNGYYGDVSLLPHNINDVVNADGLAEKSRASFDSLPDDIKALFDNDPAKFFDAVLTNKVDSILATYKPVKPEEKASSSEEGGSSDGQNN